jgi:hypothetical protein
MDPVTDVRALLDMRSAQFARLEANRAWAIDFPRIPAHQARSRPHRFLLDPGRQCSADQLGEGDCLLGNGRAAADHAVEAPGRFESAGESSVYLACGP